MEHAEKPAKELHDAHKREKKNPYFLWFSESSQIIGIFMAVSIVVAGSVLVFAANNANKRNNKNQDKKEQQQVKKQRVSVRNINARLSNNDKNIQKRVAAVNRTLNAAPKSTKDTSSAASAVSTNTVTSDDISILTQRRVTELWQAENALLANNDISSATKNKIRQKLSRRMSSLNNLRKNVPPSGTPQQLNTYYKKVQDQKIYSCYLPNIFSQIATEDLSGLTNGQSTINQDLSSLASDLSKQKVRRSDQLSTLIRRRTAATSQIAQNVQRLQQGNMQAEQSNCATLPPSVTPITRQYTDLTTLDQQIRALIDQILADQGQGKNIPTQTPPKNKKNRPTRSPKNKTNPTQTQATPAEEAPEATPVEEATPAPSEGQEPTPTEDGNQPESGPLEKPDFASLGLPNPQASGVSDLKAQIEGDERALWATKALLAGEKKAIEKGMNVIPYLTTGWIWFENGSAAWPDPYEINCNDNRSGYYSEVSIICTVTNYQVAGYQAASLKSQYVSLFTKFYKPEELASVVQRVASDSKNAIRPAWNYNDPGQQKGVNKQYISQLSSVKIGDISPNVDFFSEKGQYFSLLAGKDPTMVVALNSFAVSDDDLVGALKGGCAYGYICQDEKQILSNMVGALYELDGGTL